MRNALLAVAALALAGFVVIAFVLPKMASQKASQAAQALIAGAEPAQKQVAAVADKAGTLTGSGKDVKLDARKDPRFGNFKWLVSENGAIRAWNEDNAIEVVFMPQLQAGKTVWSCRGFPVSAMPADCGGR